ncbi:MAG: hypothetical protein ABA06_03030 [Parcubacteria bacterium C7867-001]|nr:MAG: hypothetical protein ABA06_03030 [Parcubacteria bacterium C7867-001]
MTGSEGPSSQPEGKEQQQRRYGRLLDTYSELYQRIQAHHRARTGLADETTQARLRVLEEKRHNLHLQLIALGSSLGKEKSDVLVDIIRDQRTLEEYGLPEFSILTENDIIEDGNWHNPYSFNIDSDEKGEGFLPGAPKRFIDAEEESQRLIGPDKCIIVFSIDPVVDGGTTHSPADIEARRRRAKALAESIKGEVIDMRDSEYHEAYAQILGVEIPKKDLEGVARIIRDNPELYRLKDEYYSEEERKEAAEEQKWIDGRHK